MFDSYGQIRESSTNGNDLNLNTIEPGEYILELVNNGASIPNALLKINAPLDDQSTHINNTQIEKSSELGLVAAPEMITGRTTPGDETLSLIHI